MSYTISLFALVLLALQATANHATLDTLYDTPSHDIGQATNLNSGESRSKVETSEGFLPIDTSSRNTVAASTLGGVGSDQKFDIPVGSPVDSGFSGSFEEFQASRVGDVGADTSNDERLNSFSAKQLFNRVKSTFNIINAKPLGDSIERRNGPDESVDLGSQFSGSGISDVERLSGNQFVNNINTGEGRLSDVTLINPVSSSDESRVTITKEVTVDVFKTLTNVIYNSVPVTLTEFLKTTLTKDVPERLETAVDDRVYVATAPVTITNTLTVLDTVTAFQCDTKVSSVFYTVTHTEHDIRHQIVTSTVVNTRIFRPTVVSTRIMTEYDTQTVEKVITNTVVLNRPPVANNFDLRSASGSFSSGAQNQFGSGVARGSVSGASLGGGSLENQFGSGAARGSGSAAFLGTGSLENQFGSGAARGFGSGAFLESSSLENQFGAGAARGSGSGAFSGSDSLRGADSHSFGANPLQNFGSDIRHENVAQSFNSNVNVGTSAHYY